MNGLSYKIFQKKFIKKIGVAFFYLYVILKKIPGKKLFIYLYVFNTIYLNKEKKNSL